MSDNGKATEPVLPHTPTNEGHDLPVKSLFYNLRFYEITKPLLIGFCGSGIFGMMAVSGTVSLHWAGWVALIPMPLVLVHLYLKLLVEGAPPGKQHDMAARLLALEPDYDQPLVSWLPFIPSLRPNLTMCSEPEPASIRHPLLRLQDKFEQLAQEKNRHGKALLKITRRGRR